MQRQRNAGKTADIAIHPRIPLRTKPRRIEANGARGTPYVYLVLTGREVGL
jgi:hypothetical protein